MTLLVLSLLLEQEEEPKPLADVVIYVSKKLSKRQSELNAVAASLGADYRYQRIQTTSKLPNLHPNTLYLCDLFLEQSIRFHRLKQFLLQNKAIRC